MDVREVKRTQAGNVKTLDMSSQKISVTPEKTGTFNRKFMTVIMVKLDESCTIKHSR